MKKAAMQKVALQKKPAGTGLQELQKWAEEDNDEHKPDDAKDDTSAPTKAQARVFTAALAKPIGTCLLYTSPSPRDAHESRMPSSA